MSSTSEKKRDKKRARKDKFVADLEDVFDLPLDLNGSLPDLIWQGTMVKLAAASDSIPPSLHIVRKIIWEIVEDNWRLELLALDRCILSRRGMLQTDAGLRDEKVATCFPSSDLLVHVFPMWDASLGAQDSMNQLVYLNQFVGILSSWPIPGVGDFKNVRLTTQQSPAHQESVEKQAFSFYCQVFFNYFGRAPTIPRPIPRILHK